jgi:hypothetical protein
MQLWLLWCTLTYWLVIFCMARIIYRRGVAPWNRYCGSLSMSGMKRKTFCTVRKGEKTSTNFGWLLNETRFNLECLMFSYQQCRIGCIIF